MSEINVKYGDNQRSFPAPLTVLDAFKALDRDVLKRTLAAKVNGSEVDLGSQLPETGETVSIEPITSDSTDGLELIRHSTAHLLAAAILDLFPGTKLGVGPALMEDPRYGYYYDIIAPRQLTEADLPVIEKKMKSMAKQNLPYRREIVEKAKILDIFTGREEPLKCELIADKVTDTASIYYIDNSPFIDFCLGPHVPHTGKLGAFKLLALSGAYWKGDAEREQMQRIYGTAFAKQEELDAWLKQREEAEKRDHRKLGRELDLFSISDDYGQGLILWHPKGGIVRMEMERLLKEELEKRGYSFVFTPHIAKRALWVTSGHEGNYSDSMYAPTSIEDEEYRLKPMNCPFHIGIYKSSPRSYRDLPQRYSEMGTVYRAELSGTLHGLMRVRGFSVDDAHLFVRPDQVHAEVADCLDFAIKVFETYGFDKVKFELSVRGGAENKGYLGSDEDWAAAEEQLASALKERGISYDRIEGEAAFYGPKIDIKIEDAIGRVWQLGTIQLDFNLPERFDLEYTGDDNQKHRPYMIHRALFGSIERFFGVLIEHYAGAFPLWLAPVQVTVLPITDRINDYAEQVAAELRDAGFRVEANTRSDKIGAKIRDAQMQKIPYMLVLGDQELENKQVAVRERKQGDIGAMSLNEFKEMITLQKEKRSL
ncbi:MAG TPA: threonine--tRNA ligase [Pyrinomonadaceae bacterium]|nr:threonine--tRNA ligase [Chloracidobacterium sp.]MBP9936196.1 threonine--tRNA ligase [Pyrinomonadaceae bacterium]MBK7803762.1 threonine--tRNA ligase [Chloracidobacterium sp.]MBL0239147.1 threonine--tRNA ligase [Chloracidobacterium sp.]HQX56204.1 threonine--tRNA ligase [Pyrinomonadaceae bacterium]